jgi:hypothetical protein
LVLNATVAEQQSLSDVIVLAGERVTLEDSGMLLEYSHLLTSDQRVGGLLCAAAFRVWRYASGCLSVLVLASPSTVDGIAYPRGTELFLDEGGCVLRSYSVDLDSDARYKKRVFGVFEAAFA